MIPVKSSRVTARGHLQVVQTCFGGLEVGSCVAASPSWLFDYLEVGVETTIVNALTRARNISRLNRDGEVIRAEPPWNILGAWPPSHGPFEAFEAALLA